MTASWPFPWPHEKIAHYTAYRVDEPIRVDGRLDEEAWQMAPRSPRFVDLIRGQRAIHDTRAAVLWDDPKARPRVGLLGNLVFRLITPETHDLGEMEFDQPGFVRIDALAPASDIHPRGPAKVSPSKLFPGQGRPA